MNSKNQKIKQRSLMEMTKNYSKKKKRKKNSKNRAFRWDNQKTHLKINWRNFFIFRSGIFVLVSFCEIRGGKNQVFWNRPILEVNFLKVSVFESRKKVKKTSLSTGGTPRQSHAHFYIIFRLILGAGNLVSPSAFKLNFFFYFLR